MANKQMHSISIDSRLWVNLVASVFGTRVDELDPPDAQEVYKIMKRRLCDLKTGALMGVWEREEKLRGGV